MIDNFKGKSTSFLSNFANCRILYEGIVYPSAEHAFQASKTDNNELRMRIANLKTPAEAKKFGRLYIKTPKGWGELRLVKMREILKIKFALPAFRDSLLATGTEELVEGNNWGDKFWGKCDGEGSNHLGIILMEIREELRK